MNPNPESSGLKYVSRGGHKLRSALDHFALSASGQVCLDIGSSTGGFTDCLLQDGAPKVIALDVGYGLLDYGLRKDPRVQILERSNFRHFDASVLTERPTFITIDVSFISLAKILPHVLKCFAKPLTVLAMVKPQFEGTKKEVPGGFVKDEETRQLILNRTREMIEATGFMIKGTFDSAVKGRQGNQETFYYLEPR